MLSVIIVNFNGGYRLRQTIDACIAHPVRGGLELIVIENESSDDSADFLELPEYKNVKVVRPGVNVGYTAGNNIGYAEASGDIVLLMTPDRYPVDDALDRIMERFEEDDRLGAIGGFCVSPTGRFEQEQLRGLPTVWQSYLCTFWNGRGAERFPSLKNYFLAGTDFTQPAFVPQPQGGALAFRRRLIEPPLMDERFGIYCSDIEVCRRIADTRMRTVVYPDIRFVHDHEHKPPSPVSGPILTLDYYVGLATYHRRYDGIGAYLALKLLFGIQLVAWLALEGAAVLVRRQTLIQFRRHARVVFGFFLNQNPIVEKARRELASVNRPPPAGTSSIRAYSYPSGTNKRPK